MANSSEPTTLRFGDFELDLRDNVLRESGVPVKLQPQPFRVLQILIERAPRVVSREELGSLIWGSEVHVDLEQSINFCIRQIRAALNDSAANPRFIDTLPKQGYRFIAEISKPTDLTEAAEIDNVTSPTGEPTQLATANLSASEKATDKALLRPTSINRRSLLLLGGAAVLTAGGAWVGRSLWRRPREGAINVFMSLPEGAEANDPGHILGPPAVSPDGTAVIVALNTAQGNYLFMRRLDTDRLVRMEGTLDASRPFWSPDSLHIGFFANAKLKRMPVSGGSPVTLCEASGSRGGTWGTAGVIIFGINFAGLFQVPDTGGNATPATELNVEARENSHRNPAFLPDGVRFLYFARSDDPERRALYLASLKTPGDRKRIGIVDSEFALGRDPEDDAWYLVSQQAGRILTQRFDIRRGELAGESRVLLDRDGSISISETGVLVIRTEQATRTRLQWFDRTGKQLEQVGEAGDYWSAAIAPNSELFLAVRHDGLTGHFQVWTASRSHGLLEPLSRSDHAFAAVWAHNSRAVLYNDTRENKLIEARVPPGGPETPLMDLGDGKEHLLLLEDVSQDGRFALATLVTDVARSSLVWSEVKHVPEWHPVGAIGALGLHANFSPDGKWLAFASEESGRSEIYIADFPRLTQRHRLTAAGGHTPRWRRDGKEIFYVAPDGTLMSAGVSLGSIMEAATPQKLFRPGFRLDRDRPLYDVTGDGQNFLIICGDNSPQEANIELVLHWPALLERTT